VGWTRIQLGHGPKASKAYLETLAPLVAAAAAHSLLRSSLPANVKPDGTNLYYLDLKERMFG